MESACVEGPVGLRVAAVDDEPLALADIVRALEASGACSDVRGFLTPNEALEYLGESAPDALFCDIEMPGMNGIAFAKAAKEIAPEVHIVFVTSYESYALDAFALHATGYLLKPVDEDELRRELTFVYEHAPTPDNRVEVRTFGGFEVLVNGRPLAFKRAKAKELLAFLVDRQGAGVSSREVCEILWEGTPHSSSRRSYYQTVVSSLRATLADAGVEGILVKSWNSLAVAPEALDCDLYRFLAGDPQAINAYRGNYLPAYSWAEFSIGALDRVAFGRS